MKKYIFPILTSLFIFTSCNFSSKKNTTEIMSIVDNSEVLVNRYDKNIQSYIDGKRFEYINTISEVVSDSLKVKLDQLNSIKITSNQEKLKDAAANYIKSLQNVVVSQKVYALLTDSTTLKQAKDMDDVNASNINMASKSYEAYIKQLEALK